MKDPGDMEKLQQAWQERAGSDHPGEACPEPDAIWEAQRGDLEAEEVERIVRHVAECPSCAEAWRLAREMGAMDERSVVRVRFDRRDSRQAPRLFRPLALAAGLVLLIGIGAAVLFMGQQPADPGVVPGEPKGIVMRTTGAETIQSQIPEDVPVPKNAFRLSWSAGPAGTRYTVRVTTTGLAQVDLAEGLEKAEHIVPPEALRELASGTRLLWQVQAFYPDGRQVTSPTFFAILQ